MESKEEKSLKITAPLEDCVFKPVLFIYSLYTIFLPFSPAFKFFGFRLSTEMKF